MKQLRVVVIDDSATAREELRSVFEADGDILVIGEADDGDRAVSLVSELRPDLATIDIQMPGVDGLKAIGRIMAHHPVPILVVTGQPAGKGSPLVFESLKRGALDIVGKPERSAKAGADLRTLVRRLAKLPVVRHVAGLHEAPSRRLTPPAPPWLDLHSRPPCKVIGIGASASGPAAIAAILSQLPADLPVCIAVVQHLSAGFAASFAQYLSSNTSLKVETVARRTECLPGRVLVAADDRHLMATPDGAFVVTSEAPVGGHRPAVDVLFRSLAKVFGAAAVGVVLTGIGNDGTAGMIELAGVGALTVAQDEPTSAVYGMPKAARESGAVQYVLPLTEIPTLLMSVIKLSTRHPRRD